MVHPLDAAARTPGGGVMESKATYDARTAAQKELDECVLQILRRHIGKENRVDRTELVRRAYGIPPSMIDEYPAFDRRVRESVARLRKNWVILSSSETGGYWLAESIEEAKAFLDEMESRALKELATVSRMRANLARQFSGQME